MNFIDFEKAFDSLDRSGLWRLMEHYGIPAKYINIVKQSYKGTASRVLHIGEQSELFEIRLGVKQGCLLSPFLFLLAIDWVMTQTKDGHRNGIQWTLSQPLDDLNFADNQTEAGTTEEVGPFSYLGSVVDQEGGSEEDVRVRIEKSKDSIQDAPLSMDVKRDRRED